MDKLLIDARTLEDIGSKFQQLEELLDVLQNEAQVTMRTCVICDIGLDIARRTAMEIDSLVRSGVRHA